MFGHENTILHFPLLTERNNKKCIVFIIKNY